jgi:hypothetical protein
VAQHLDHRTFRLDRHAPLIEREAPAERIAPSLRKVALRDLEGHALAVVKAMLSEFGDWDRAGIELLRSFAQSCARLETLARPGESLPELRRETRLNLQLRRALDLEPRAK